MIVKNYYKVIFFNFLGLWNTDFDNCVSLNYKGKFMWASAAIYVLYTE